MGVFEREDVAAANGCPYAPGVATDTTLIIMETIPVGCSKNKKESIPTIRHHGKVHMYVIIYVHTCMHNVMYIYICYVMTDS